MPFNSADSQQEINLITFYFSFPGRKSLAIYIVTNILENDTLIPTPETVDLVLMILAPLIQEQPDQSGNEEDPEDFDEEQGLLGR